MPAEFIWHNGQLVRWEDATVHVTAHALHYGTSAFEGVRAYATDQGPAVFRLQPHTRRLFNSSKIARMTVPFTEIKSMMLSLRRSAAMLTSRAMSARW